ncbi:MAG: hypothetical protein L6R39_005866 [Caloplaca ligustica]|nr:MAG: hypothetical protein L6R39_005866 [Caloplaca ligustica]
MSHLKNFTLAHLPDEIQVYAVLYKDVENAAFLQQQLLAGNAAFEYAFIDASAIVSSTHLLAAVFRAATDWLNGRLKSKNVHSEIVFCLSMNNNIAESFRRFGISPTTTSLYAVKVSKAPSVNAETVHRHLSESIEGNQLPFDDAEIARLTDIAKLRKIYKLIDTVKGGSKTGSQRGRGSRNEVGGSTMANGDTEKKDAEKKELEMMVLGLMALRGAT